MTNFMFRSSWFECLNSLSLLLKTRLLSDALVKSLHFDIDSFESALTTCIVLTGFCGSMSCYRLDELGEELKKAVAALGPKYGLKPS